MKLEFHHINFVSEDVDRMHAFYTRVLQMDDVPASQFPRTEATGDRGFDGKIKFATEGSMQMHLAERDFKVHFKNGQTINPVERGHIAFRTDDLPGFLALLDAEGIPYSDYGTTFSAGWHQVFFQDPEGNIIEVHQQVAKG
ncbi:MAG: VOC family protein [Pseudomonadota bacterium]